VRELGEFNLHSILIPIRYRGISIFVIYFLRRQRRRYPPRRGLFFFRGSTPMRIDVASSSIKFSSDKLPISLMIPAQFPILATRGVATSRMQRRGLVPANESFSVIRINYGESMNQTELLNDQSCRVSSWREKDTAPPPAREREIRNYRSSFRRGADSRDVCSLGSLEVTPRCASQATLSSFWHLFISPRSRADNLRVRLFGARLYNRATCSLARKS